MDFNFGLIRIHALVVNIIVVTVSLTIHVFLLKLNYDISLCCFKNTYITKRNVAFERYNTEYNTPKVGH